MEPPPVPDPALAARPVYDAAAVDGYIDELHAELEELRRVVADAKPAGGTPVEVEAMLGRVLINAQRTADDALGDAQRRGELIVTEAHREADRIEAAAHERAARIVEDAYRRAERIVGATGTGSTGRGLDEAAARAADLEAQRIIDEAHRRLDAIFAPTRRATEEAPGTSTHPDAGAAPWPPRPDTGPSASPGRIVSLRPEHPSDQAAAARESWPPPGSPSAVEVQRDEDLLATGTDATPRPVPVPVLVALPRRDAEPVPAPEAPPPPRVHVAPERPRPTRSLFSLIRERWRVARDGTSGFDDELLGRSGHLASLTDGTYVDQLRPDSTGGAKPVGPRHFARAQRRHGVLLTLLASIGF